MIANNLIGMDWWRWQNHGDSRPKIYDIKVVVYRDLDLEALKKDYPVLPLKKQDYRYVSFGDALKYLNKHINENVMEQLTEALTKTKKGLVHSFSEK